MSVRLNRIWFYWWVKNGSGILRTGHQLLRGMCALARGWQGSFLLNFSHWPLSDHISVKAYSHQANMGQNDTIGKIELKPSIVLSSDNTNCKEWHSIVPPAVWWAKCLQRLPLTPPGAMSEANSGMTLHSLVLRCDSFSCNCNSIE